MTLWNSGVTSIGLQPEAPGISKYQGILQDVSRYYLELERTLSVTFENTLLCIEGDAGLLRIFFTSSVHVMESIAPFRVQIKWKIEVKNLIDGPPLRRALCGFNL